MKRYLLLVLALGALAAFVFPSAATAQSGHFVGTPTCTDIGTQVQCSGKVAGLGGTTFEITVAAEGIATVECTNPAGNVAPGQDTAVDISGGSGPLPTPTNGRFLFSLTSDDPEPLPPTPTCPNRRWEANITDVEFGPATLTLRENGTVSDTITVPVS